MRYWRHAAEVRQVLWRRPHRHALVALLAAASRRMAHRSGKRQCLALRGQCAGAHLNTIRFNIAPVRDVRNVRHDAQVHHLQGQQQGCEALGLQRSGGA